MAENSKDFALNDTVRITVGVFANLSGTIDHLDPANRRAIVMLAIDGRGTPVELDFAELEPIG